MNAGIFVGQAEQRALLSFVHFLKNAFSLSTVGVFGSRGIQGHLKGRGGKNWAYIFDANPLDGALISPN